MFTCGGPKVKKVISKTSVSSYRTFRNIIQILSVIYKINEEKKVLIRTFFNHSKIVKMFFTFKSWFYSKLTKGLF